MKHPQLVYTTAGRLAPTTIAIAALFQLLDKHADNSTVARKLNRGEIDRISQRLKSIPNSRNITPSFANMDSPSHLMFVTPSPALTNSNTLDTRTPGCKKVGQSIIISNPGFICHLLRASQILGKTAGG